MSKPCYMVDQPQPVNCSNDCANINGDQFTPDHIKPDMHH